MPWSGGQFTRIYNWVNDKNAGIPITASRMDGDSDDFASGINNCIAKDGSNTPTANLNLGSFRYTSVGSGTALTDAVNLNQVQAGVLNWGVASGTADALTLTLSPAQTTIADGTIVGVRAASANATTAPTFALNGTTARTIVRTGGLPLAIGDIPGQYAEFFLRYNSANTRWELLNPAAKALQHREFTGSGTFTVPANALPSTVFRFNVTGGGGGGAGASATGGAGAGGGAGATAIYYATGLSAGATIAVTVGAAGAGGTAGANNGSNGGNSTIVVGATTITGGLGSGGSASGSASAPAGGAGGTATNGSINISGGDGQSGQRYSAADTAGGTGGPGGASFYGGGGYGAPAGNQGRTANAYGAGGGGGGSTSGASAAGGDGKAGIVTVEWVL